MIEFVNDSGEKTSMTFDLVNWGWDFVGEREGKCILFDFVSDRERNIDFALEVQLWQQLERC